MIMPFEKIKLINQTIGLNPMHVVRGEIYWRMGLSASTMKLFVSNTKVTAKRKFNIKDNGSGGVRVIDARNYGDDTSQFDVTNPSGDTHRFTWDGTGTDPEFHLGLRVGHKIVISASSNFAAGNQGIYEVDAVDVDGAYFEVTNPAGVTEINKTLAVDDGLMVYGRYFRRKSWVFGDGTSQFDVSNPAGNTFRYTWDGTGTATGFNYHMFIGDTVVIEEWTEFATANQGTFTVTGVDASGAYFEVTNAAGVVENNKTLRYAKGIKNYKAPAREMRFVQGSRVIVSGFGTVEPGEDRVSTWVNNYTIDLSNATYSADEFGRGKVKPGEVMKEGDIVLAEGENRTYHLFRAVVERLKIQGPFIVAELTGILNFMNGKYIQETYSTLTIENLIDNMLAVYFLDPLSEINLYQLEVSNITIQRYNIKSTGKKLIKDMMDISKFQIVEGYNNDGGAPEMSDIVWSELGHATPGAFEQRSMESGVDGVVISSEKAVDTIRNRITMHGTIQGNKMEITVDVNVLAAAPDFPNFTFPAVGTTVRKVFWDDGIGGSGWWYGGTALDSGADYYIQEDYSAEVTWIYPAVAPIVNYTATVYYEVIPSYFTELRNDASIAKYGERWDKATNIDIKDIDDAESLAQEYLDRNSNPELRGVFTGPWNYGFMPNMRIALWDRRRDIKRWMLLEEIKIVLPQHMAEYYFSEGRITFQQWMERIDISRSIAHFTYDRWVQKQGAKPEVNVEIDVNVVLRFRDDSVGREWTIINTDDRRNP